MLEKSFEAKENGIFFNGNVRALFVSGDDEEGGGSEDCTSIPVVKAGKIEQWWITGMTDGDTPSLGITTALADYYLQQPTKE